MKKIFTLIAMAVMAIGANAQEDTWTVAGTSGICGVSWDPTATQNDMTSNDGGQTFTLVKEGCVLEANTENQYKVVKNHDWNNGAFPSDNKVFKVSETGTYTVTFTFVVATSEVSESYEKTGSAVIGEKTWTVAGSNKEILGAEWDPTATANDMVKQADGTFKLIKANLTLTEGEINFKVAANHAWDESYGAEGGNSNNYAEVPAGTFDVVFTFNADTHINAVSFEPAGSASGINAITTKAENNGALYNLAGQQVNKNYKGIVIQNGKKFMNK